MTPHDNQPDPRSRRALLLGGALLALIAAWNIDWWDGDEHEGMRIEAGQSEDIGDTIRREVRENIAEARREAREGRDNATERAIDNAVDNTTEPRAIEVERDARGG